MLDPQPVGECEHAADGHGGQDGDGPWRGEEEEVDDEGEGGDEVEADVCCCWGDGLVD